MSADERNMEGADEIGEMMPNAFTVDNMTPEIGLLT
jgi:hypothetical protein